MKVASNAKMATNSIFNISTENLAVAWIVQITTLPSRFLLKPSRIEDCFQKGPKFRLIEKNWLVKSIPVHKSWIGIINYPSGILNLFYIYPSNYLKPVFLLLLKGFIVRCALTRHVCSLKRKVWKNVSDRSKDQYRNWEYCPCHHTFCSAFI